MTDARPTTTDAGRWGPDWAIAFDFPVERGKILELARALGSTHPAFVGEDALAPPTFLALGVQIWGCSWERPGDSVLADWGESLLHLEEEYRFLGAPLRAGDLLHGTTVLREPVHKVGRRSGPMTLLELTTEYRDGDGTPVATARQLVARREAVETLDQDGGAAPAAAEHAPAADEPAGAAGPALAPRRHGPLTLEDTVTFQGACGDLNALHYDAGVLREAGFDTFFSPGMLQAGLMSIPLVDAYGPTALRAIRFRFGELVEIGDTITCTAVPTARDGDELTVELGCTRSDGRVAVSGQARVAAS